MKLIIDIDEDTYRDIKKGKVYSSMRDVPQESVLAIANGTPLDKIRAEIAEYKDDKLIHAERNEMIDIVLEIIDRYTKGEHT